MCPPDSTTESEAGRHNHHRSTPDSHQAVNMGGHGSAGDDDDEVNENDLVHSLGEALAGVTMGTTSTASANGGSSNNNNHVSSSSAEKRYSSSSPVSNSPFALGVGGGTGGGSAQKDTSSDGWGNFSSPSDVPGHAFSSSSTASLKENLTGTAGGRGDNGSVTMANGGTGRSEELELFLSHGASKALGDSVFRFSQQNLATLGNDDSGGRRSVNQTIVAPGPVPPAPTATASFGDLRSNSMGAVGGDSSRRGRTESPSCSVTGTTTSSRSCSPYTNTSVDVNGSNRMIHAYQRFDSSNAPNIPNSSSGNNIAGNDHIIGRSNQPSFAEDDRSSSGYSLSHGHGSHPSLATMGSNVAHGSPYSKERASVAFNGNKGGPAMSSPFDAMKEPHRTNSYASLQENNSLSSPPPQMPTSAAPNSTSTSGGQPQPQVLYMAVPSPDGRGQVLQPVQMVQLPGKPYHFVANAAPTGGTPNSVNEQPSMMVLPPLPNQQNVSSIGTPNGSDVGTIPSSPSYQQQQLDNRSRISPYAIDTSLNRSSSPYSATNEFSTPLAMTPRGEEFGSVGTTSSSLGGASSPSPYQMDSAVSSLYSSPQRPPLEALLGEVRRLSRDQVGCRLVQQALDEEGPMAATLILNEGLPFWAEAMVDPFGNYLFQKILEKVTAQERVMLVKSVSPRLVNASLNLHGTRSVQKVVEMCAQDEQLGQTEGLEETAADILTNALAPAAARLCIDSHGNHVIQRILLKLGPKHTRFVFDAVAASVGDVARHRHGCCVIQRCLDSPPNEARAHLVRRIVEKSLELMQDAYGNYVVQYVLDVCSDEDVHAVCESVAGKVNLLAIQKFSSNVMEKCLERCSDRVKEMYLHEMSDPDRIRELMMDPFGNYVVQRALSVATHAQAIRLVEAMRPHLLSTQTSGPHGQRNGGVRNTAGGRRIIAKICRRFPNFTLTAVSSQDELYTSNKGHHHHHHHHHAHHQPHHGGVRHPYPPHQVASGGLTAGGYSAVVGPPIPSNNLGLGSQLNYGADPRLAPGLNLNLPIQQQQQPPPQQSYYTLGGSPYGYEPYTPNGGLGGFGM